MTSATGTPGPVHTSHARIRIGFVLHATGWLGGLNYFRSLFRALSAVPDCSLEPIVFTGKTGGKLADHLHVPLVSTAALDKWTSPWVLRKGTAKLFGQDYRLQSFLRKHDISLLSHSVDLGKGSALRTIGWIPDFQHLHLPQLFSKRERLRRDRYFLRLCSHCDRVLVSSESAKLDLESFAPQHIDKAEVLRFVASPPSASGIAPSQEELERRHGFTGRYFLLPNQFWAHKNHRIVIDALDILKRNGRRVLVLATGETNDTRNPSFFDSLSTHLKKCAVEDSFRILGVLPSADLHALMLRTVALINPSRFEGWSTVVEEAKSLGKTVLLSDIPVHREQSPEFGRYFPPDNPEMLADALWNTWTAFDPLADSRAQEQARRAFPARQHEFGRNFQRIALETLSS